MKQHSRMRIAQDSVLRFLITYVYGRYRFSGEQMKGAMKNIFSIVYRAQMLSENTTSFVR